MKNPSRYVLRAGKQPVLFDFTVYLQKECPYAVDYMDEIMYNYGKLGKKWFSCSDAC